MENEFYKSINLERLQRAFGFIQHNGSIVMLRNTSDPSVTKYSFYLLKDIAQTYFDSDHLSSATIKHLFLYKCAAGNDWYAELIQTSPELFNAVHSMGDIYDKSYFCENGVLNSEKGYIRYRGNNYPINQDTFIELMRIEKSILKEGSSPDKRYVRSKLIEDAFNSAYESFKNSRSCVYEITDEPCPYCDAPNISANICQLIEADNGVLSNEAFLVDSKETFTNKMYI